jgi:hypothetical protein
MALQQAPYIYTILVVKGLSMNGNTSIFPIRLDGVDGGKFTFLLLLFI